MTTTYTTAADSLAAPRTPGTRGLGVGFLEADGAFHSVVWFPFGAMDDALDFAEANGYVVRRGIAL
jgi:hypothetical protein